MGTIRILCSLLVPLLGLLIPLAGHSQSIDTSSSAATIGEPVSMSLQVRAFDLPPSRLLPDCFSVRLQQADSGEFLTPLQIITRPSSLEGQVTLQILSPALVREPVLHGRIDLLCGAEFSREFTVLADPPRPGKGAATPSPSSTRSRTEIRGRAPTSDAPAPAVRNEAPEERQASAEQIARLILDKIQPSTLRPAEAPPRDLLTDPLWIRLGEEQHQTRLVLTELRLRLEQSERSAARDGWLVAGTLIGLGSCLMIGRLLSEGPWRHRNRPPRGTRRPRRPASALPPLQPLDRENSDGTAVSPGIADRPPSDDPDRPIDWPQGNTAEESRQCWAHSDFGQPTLTDEGSQTLLADLAPPANATPADRWHQVMALERHLIGQTTRCPWLLLRLLDLYEKLGQAGNHERVAAQLEALYNVRIPPLSTDRARNGANPGRSLEQHERTWRQVDTVWGCAQAESHLATLLVRPTLTEELDLPAFEELLTLHGVLRQRDSLARPAATSADASRWAVEMLAA